MSADTSKKATTPTVSAPQAITWTTAPKVVLVDFMGGNTGLDKMAAALDTQVKRDFAPYYHVSADIGVADPTKIPSDAWVIGLYKDADQPGALGYHDTTPSGLPLAKVFPILDAQDGSPLSVTISHELLEMLADPLLCKAVQSVIDGKFWAYEVADAVENDQYEIDGVAMSNFVLPAYFEPPKQGTPKYDIMGLITKPYEVRSGGYMQYFDTRGWHQVVNQESSGMRSYRKAIAGVGRGSHRKRRMPEIAR